MTKKTANPYHIKTLNELDNFLFDKNNENTLEPILFKKVAEGLKKINNDHYSSRDKDIQIFLRSIFENTNPEAAISENLLPWFDMGEYKEMIELIRKDKDRAGTSSLKDLQIYKKPLTIDDFSIFNAMAEKLPNFQEVVNFYRGAFAMNKTKPANLYSAPRPILLLGEAGIGKTVFANSLAKTLNTSYKFLDANSISSSWILSGNNATWRGAEAGMIFKSMSTSSTLSPVIALDEIDKLQISNQNSPFSVFHQMFEKENSSRFYDEFLKFYFDASNIIYILTANNIQNIPESLLSRMEIYNIPNPDQEQMRTIATSIYTKEINGSKYFCDHLSEENLDIISRMKPREAQKIISRSVNIQLSSNSLHLDKQNQPLILNDKQIVKRQLGF